MRFLADLGGTLLQKWRLGLSTLNGEALTASRVHSLPDTSGTLATEAWVEELIAGLPRAGDLLSIEFFPGKRSALAAARPGCVPLDGTVLNRSEWPDAWGKIPEWFLVATDANWLAGQYGYFSSGNGTTTFRLPDLNGSISGHVRRVLRGTSGDGGGLTEAAMQGHKHGSVVAAVGGTTTGTPETLGPTSVGGASVSGAYHSSGMTAATGPQTLSGSPYSDGTNGTPAVANETRPASVDGVWIVRLANAAVNEGAVDVLELASEVEFIRSQMSAGSLIKETYYSSVGAFTHNFDPNTATYEIEAWSAGAGGGNNPGSGGSTSFGAISITGARANPVNGAGYAGIPGVASGGLLNLSGNFGGACDSNAYFSAGAGAPRGGGGSSRTAAGPVAGSQPGGGGGSSAIGQQQGSSGAYSFDRKPLTPGPSNSISGVIGAGGIAGTGGAKGGDGMVIVREFSGGGPNVDLVAGLYDSISALENDSFTTDWLPFSVGGQLIIENLLEAVTADWAAELKCVVAQGGYLVGAEVPCLVGADSYTNAGFQITKNTSSEIRVRVGRTYSVSLLNPDTGANFRTTPTSWLVRFRFWRKG